ncbi:transcriptional regulator [Saccharothrix sp. ALI-22-I]|uniref:transcriptional regulator n=1 Tax=Saccharothrix sp. ALI-22-I TaxID=1933778 RepID=UPI001EE73CE9|nr:transcriptional regulator [Saccharothrix sp. ALI-22-I]
MRTFRTLLEQKIWERRMTLEEFAEYAEMFARKHGEVGTIGVRHLQRLIAGRKPSGEPLSPVKPVTARLLESIFGIGIEELLAPPVREDAGGEGGAGRPSRNEVDLAVVLDWLDERVGWGAGSSRREVLAKVAEGRTGVALDRRARRSRAGRSALVRRLTDYYGVRDGAYGVYGTRWGSDEVVTSILTRSDWLDLAVPLGGERDRLTLANGRHGVGGVLSEGAATAAVSRLAESVALGVHVTNLPLYRLLRAEVGATVAGEVGLVPFAEYALTVDLLEGELVDAVVSGSAMPLRREFLPDLAAVLDLRGRVCAGGVLALCAIARPHDASRGGPDYALLVQERSGHVLNTAGRLAVIPKGFHQPLTDVRADARVGATLLRELEEELFGRSEVDTAVRKGRAASPMHPGRWSVPMRWLAEEPGRWRMECTGFGFNLVSGNYEFASLVVIEDEEFWPRFGGQVEANWEASGLRLYSSLDDELLTDLVTHESWSNEGLFALLQGLRRLSEIGGARVRLPAFELSGL